MNEGTIEEGKERKRNGNEKKRKKKKIKRKSFRKLNQKKTIYSLQANNQKERDREEEREGGNEQNGTRGRT